MTEAEPLVAYVYSMSPPWAPTAEWRVEFARFVQDHLDRAGALHITKATGIIIATHA